jgi:transposase
MKGAMAAMAVKTDRNDARAIGQAMRVGWFTAVHVKTSESQELRPLLTNRKTLLTACLNLENEIRGTLKAFGLKVGVVRANGYEARVLELIDDRPRIQEMVRPMLLAREALRLNGVGRYACPIFSIRSAAALTACCTTAWVRSGKSEDRNSDTSLLRSSAHRRLMAVSRSVWRLCPPSTAA